MILAGIKNGIVKVYGKPDLALLVEILNAYLIGNI